VIAMDYRGAPDVMRWAFIPSYAFASLGLFVDSNGLRRVLGGGNDGYVKRLNVADRSIDGSTALSYRVTTPHMNYGVPMVMKTATGGALGISPKGNFNITFGWTRDDQVQQTLTVAQGGTAVLGTASSNQFTLDDATLGKLGGARYVDRFFPMEEGGEFRSIQFQVTQSATNEDVELHAITQKIEMGAESMET
jgi:hypothetical protein